MKPDNTNGHARAHDAASWVHVDELKPWSQNPRKNDKRAPAVAALIKRFGFGAPIVARLANKEIIGGHTRQKATRLLMAEWARTSASERVFIDEHGRRQSWHDDAQYVAQSGLVPVRFVDLDEEDAHLYALADNRSTEQTPWDEDALRKILPGFSLDDIQLAGWSAEQLAKMTARDESSVEEIAVSDLHDEFWLSVRGPVPEQPKALELLRDALSELDGVDVNLGTTGTYAVKNGGER